jgi:hypothetical protein
MNLNQNLIAQIQEIGSNAEPFPEYQIYKPLPTFKKVNIPMRKIEESNWEQRFIYLEKNFNKIKKSQSDTQESLKNVKQCYEKLKVELNLSISSNEKII